MVRAERILRGDDTFDVPRRYTRPLSHGTVKEPHDEAQHWGYDHQKRTPTLRIWPALETFPSSFSIRSPRSSRRGKKNGSVQLRRRQPGWQLSRIPSCQLGRSHCRAARFLNAGIRRAIGHLFVSLLSPSLAGPDRMIRLLRCRWRGFLPPPSRQQACKHQSTTKDECRWDSDPHADFGPPGQTTTAATRVR